MKMKERCSAIFFFLQLLLLLILTDSSTCKDVATGVSESKSLCSDLTSNICLAFLQILFAQNVVIAK